MRDYAMVHTSIWADDDFRGLTIPGQWLYEALLTAPSLSHAGVADWRPKRLAALTSGTTIRDIEAAGAELAAARFVVIDEDTEEVLVRTFIRWDGLMKKPNMAVAMAKAWAGIASKVLRGVVVHELHRLQVDQPELHGWAHPNSKAKVSEVLDQERVDPAGVPAWTPDWWAEHLAAEAQDAAEQGTGSGSRKGSVNRSGKGSANRSGNPSGNRSGRGSEVDGGNGSANGSANLCPTPSPAPNSYSSNLSLSASNEAARKNSARGGSSTDSPSNPASEAPTQAGVLMAGWIAGQQERPPSRVIGQLAKEVKQLLLDGVPGDVVRASLDEWQLKGQHPSVLSSIAHAIRSRRPGAAQAGTLPRGWEFLQQPPAAAS